MAPLMSVVVAGFSLMAQMFSVDAEKATAAVVSNDAINGINMGRTARLDNRETAVTVGATEGESAKTALEKVVTDATCAAVTVTPASDDVGGLLMTATTMTAPTAADITSLIQGQLVSGLQALSDGSYGPKTTFNTAAPPFKDASAQNVAYLMFSGSKTVGCAAVQNCTAGKSVVLCKFEPTVTKDFVAPISEAVYAAMLARQKANIDITKLQNSDLNTPLKGGGGSAAVSAVPGAVVIVLALVGLTAAH